MSNVVLIEGCGDLLVEAVLGRVSVLDVPDEAVAVSRLKTKASMMGANAIIDFQLVETLGDPQFDTRRVYARGTAVVI